MKKYILLAALFGYVLLHSCQKEGHTKSTDDVAATTSLSVSDAKNWFNQTGMGRWSGYSNSTNSMVKSFRPLWQHAYSSADSENEVVDIPLQFETVPGFTTGTSQGVGGKTSLVILKNKATKMFRSLLMHVINNSSPGSDVSYLQRTKDFTGEIFFTDLYGNFLNGWIYKKGKIIAGTRDSNKNKDAGRAPLPANCETKEIKWYERTCTFYQDNSIECSGWQYVGSTYHTYCAEEGSGGVSGSNDCDTPDGQQFVSQSGPVSELVTSASGAPKISSTGEITKEWQTSWRFYKGTFLNSTWKYISFETGVHVKLNNVWKWKSITHLSTAQDGPSPFKTTLNIISATPSISADRVSARMELNYEVKMCFECKGWNLGCISDLAYSRNTWVIAPNGTVSG